MQTAPAFQPAAAAPSRAGDVPQRRVIDAPTRVFHWLSALSFLGAYLTADGERWRALHVTLGYTLAGLLAFRVLYGLLGPRHAGMGLMLR
jgi:cytochrome b